MERARLLIVAVAAALVIADPAAAALEIRLAIVPAKAKVGQRAVVQLRPYIPYRRPDGSCCRLEPADVTYPFRVEAVSPAGRVFRVRMRKTRNPYVWSGAFTFSRTGEWTLREPHWGPGYSRRAGGKPRIRVVVGS